MITSEEIVLDRDRISCIVTELSKALEIEPAKEFKLRFSQSEDGKRLLTIIPHCEPVEIVL